ncbi:hypothetical protein C2845_PM02G22290 [Panicum miliaceum]|uniref:F-box associated beta-propeller type 1 domain-containing protein n=1 Tax=Panicum miliaceum TaxID=4540 RepID=A0A3L6S5F4_PANMI|nr:hypothetical protein C2845_PM02G22290 [Panicum miliaceum]
MAAGSKKRRRRNPATRLTDDLIVEILSRLPRLPQTLAGFFYTTTSCERFPESARHFTNVTGRGAPLIRPSLSFLPGYADIEILVSCNGLLLCRSLTAAGAVRYVVCNPATEELAALPESSQAGKICNARLGFDPAVSPHFHVFEFVETDVEPGDYVSIDGLEIYSSKTGEWAFRDSGWGGDSWRDTSMLLISVFLNGFLHVFESEHQDVLVYWWLTRRGKRGGGYPYHG